MRENEATVSVGSPRSQGVGERVDPAAHKQRVVSLFEAHNSALIRFLSIRLRSEEEAQEIAQDAYVKLLGLDEPDAINHFRAYLFKVAANLAKDRLKQRDRRAELREKAFADDETSSPPPDLVLQAAEQLAVIQESIRELPAKCRTAFQLHRIHHLTVAETARRMKLSERMVRLYVARALGHCAARLQSAMEETDSTSVQMPRTSHGRQT